MVDTVEFQPGFNIPHFLLVISEDDGGKLFFPGQGCESRTFVSAEKRLTVESSGLASPPLVSDTKKALTLVFGAPICEGRINRQKCAELFSRELKGSSALDLDGEFLVIRFGKTDASLKIVNDRFNSVPLYYFIDPEKRIFCCSPYFGSVWKFLKGNRLLKINQEALFEFLWFQRLFGIKTLARDALYMPDASVLSLVGWKLSTERYWSRTYRKNSDSLRENAHRLADLVRKSVGIKAGDGRRYGHFLSGGMDSRSVLGAFGKNLPTCFTVGVSDNREVRTARRIAETKGAPHIYLPLHPEHYGMIREAAAAICGGLYNYDHALFLGYGEAVKRHADVCFNGYGFDFMFQGMYIPGRNVRIGGRTLYLRFMSPLPENLVEYFINNASYRIKDADIWNYIVEKRRQALQDFQFHSINHIYHLGSKLTDDRNDLWEYLTFHHITRHYSYPNVLALGSFSEPRIISFTNDIFSLYLSLPAKQRFNGAIEKEALKILDPRLARIRSANTGLPVTASCWTQTGLQLAEAAKRRLFCRKDWEEWTERTWPSREYALRNQASLKNAVIAMMRSGIFETLDFLDMKKLGEDIPRWLEGKKVPGVSGDLVQTLATIGTFLKL